MLALVPDPELAPFEADADAGRRAQVASARRELGVGLACGGLLPPQVLRLKRGCVGALVGGLRRALRLATDDGDGTGLASGGDPDAPPADPLDAPAREPRQFGPPLSAAAQAYRYLVENGAVLLWNLHLPVVVRGAFAEVSPELKAAWHLAERALRAVQSRDTQLYADVATALAQTHAAQGELADAETVCRRVVLLCRPLQAQRACRLRAALAHTPGGPPPPLLPLPGAPANLMADLLAASAAAPAGSNSSAAPELPSDAPLRFAYDPTAAPPAFDEANAKRLASHAHFAVLGALEELRARTAAVDTDDALRAAADGATLACASAAGGAAADAARAAALSAARLGARKAAMGALAAPLAAAVELMAHYAAAAASGRRQAAAVAAWRVHAFAASKGGGSAGTLEAAGELPRLVGASRSCSSHEEDVEALEMRTELWARLAAEALRQSNARLAQRCCRAALGALHGAGPSSVDAGGGGGGGGASAELLLRVPPSVWRWRSVAERLWAAAIAALVSPQEQEKGTMDRLRGAAMARLLAAAQCALNAGARHAPSLCLAAARDLWNVGLPLAGSPASRRALHPFVEGVLRLLVQASALSGGAESGQPASGEAADGASDGLLRVQLFALLCECLADASRWADGLREVTEAFPHVPLTLARPLWQWRVVFLSRLGRSALDGLAKMKESDPLLQVQIFLKIKQI
jgi:hypothetical protein